MGNNTVYPRSSENFHSMFILLIWTRLLGQSVATNITYLDKRIWGYGVLVARTRTETKYEEYDKYMYILWTLESFSAHKNILITQNCMNSDISNEKTLLRRYFYLDLDSALLWEPSRLLVDLLSEHSRVLGRRSYSGNLRMYYFCLIDIPDLNT